jgi:hypothetical protein
MDREQKRNRILIVGVVLGLLALFSYVATLDDSDPNVIPESTQELGSGYE